MVEGECEAEGAKAELWLCFPGGVQVLERDRPEWRGAYTLEDAKGGAMCALGMEELLTLRGLVVVEVEGFEPYPADDPEWKEIPVEMFLAPMLMGTLKLPRLER